ncbi:MAG: GGDEF domain-containing protein [Gammaproteobacteria bacterium]
MTGENRDLPDLEWAELRGFARSVVEVEWLLVALALVYAWFADFAAGGPVLYIAFVAAFAASILLLRYTPMARRLPRVLIGLELGLMTLFVTAVSWQTGGIDSPLINLYLLPLVTSALVFGRYTTVWLFVALIACLFVLMAVSRGEAEGREFAALFTRLAPMALVTVLTMLLAENIRVSRERIRRLSEQDPLTEQFNLRAFSRRLEEVHRRAGEAGEHYALIVVDVDELRQINEAFGHEAGNRALLLVVKAVRRCARRVDILARLGGDEFILLAPGLDRSQAGKLMLRIRNSVHATTFSVGRRIIRVGASLGAAIYPEDGDDPWELVGLADRNLVRERADRQRLEAAKRPSGYPG